MTHLFDPRTIIPVLIIVVLGFGYGAIRQCSHVEYDASQIPPEMAGLDRSKLVIGGNDIGW